jgi:hypothetical protein
LRIKLPLEKVLNFFSPSNHKKCLKIRRIKTTP